MKKVMHILLFITMLSSVVLLSSTVSADDSVVDDVNITVPVSCSMSGTGMDSHNANISNGTYQPNIGTTTIHAFCNDNEGFAIYAAGYTGNEIGATNSNKLVGTSASSNSTIDTGLATTTGTPDVSNWAMKLAITQDSGDTTGTNAFTIDSDTEGPFSAYHTVPNTYTKVAHKTAATNMTASTGGVKLTTTYAAYISKNQSADTYSGQVKYTLVHPASHVAPGVLDPNVDNISGMEYLQQFAVVSDSDRQAIIDSMTPEQQYTLYDIRDNKPYTIAKHLLGVDSNSNQPIYNVWMTQNLDLDLDSSKTYTNEDTDIGYNTTTGEYDTASWTPVRSTYAPTSTHVSQEWCTGGTKNQEYGYCEVNNTPESYDPGNLYWNSVVSNGSDWNAYFDTCGYSADTLSCDQSKNPISTYISTTGIAQNHLGNYYNFATALATNDSSVYPEDEIIEQSICPAGWTLPRVGMGEESFFELWYSFGFSSNTSNGSANLWSDPLYFIPSGGYFGVLSSIGREGLFQSPVANSQSPDESIDSGWAASYFTNSGTTWNPTSNAEGHAIRCILRPVSTSLWQLYPH